MRGADLLVRSLAAAGVRKIFSLSGNQIMPVYDACIDARIEIIHTRHEAAAVFMADAWAQLTGEIGVALVTAAPGATNALGALYSARQSESPVLLLTGDSSRSQDGKGAFQELDQVAITSPLTKLSLRVASSDAFGDDVARAIASALSGRPGPVHVALPFDLLEAPAGDVGPPAGDAFRPAVETPAAADLALIADAVAAAQRPLVVFGAALNRTRFGAEIDALSNALDAPALALESPRGLKDPSLGDIAGVLAQADLILALGKPVDFTLGFGKPAAAQCRWVVVDAEDREIDRAALNLASRELHAVKADPRAMALALTAAGLGGDRRAAWRDAVAGATAKRVAPPVGNGKILPSDVTAAVQRQLDRARQSVLVCDGGEFGQWCQAGTHGDFRIINGPSGAIGGGLCYALAATQAKPDATVFALMGDGTVGFHLAEFETAARIGAAFVAVIGNDACWNAEHQIQLREYGPNRLIGCMLSEARYDLAVAAMGGHGEHVVDPAELDAALERAVASGKVACVNVVIEGLAAPAGAGH